MKNIFISSKALKVFFVCFFLSNYSAFAQKTTLWFIRHAETNTAAAQNADDPGLSPEGQKRAEALYKGLKREKIKAIYVSRTKRAAETARPLAAQIKLLPRVYGDSLKTFANAILKNFQGKTVLIIGQANSIMPLLAAFGSETPFDMLDDDDYDMLFKLTVKDSGARELEISYYGSLHHKSDLPEKYKEDNRPAQQFTSPATHY